MIKYVRWIREHILLLLTLFLLAFIPLYPKLPLLDIKNTWVYVRVEDFLIAFTLLFWLAQLIRKKVSLRTPLTIPIIVFWVIGGIATFSAIIFIFPHIANVFVNVSILSYLRRIEYLSVFFVAFSAMKSRKYTSYLIATLSFTLIAAVVYSFGQRLLGFPAYLTMNEEFAKGIPLKLSPLSRVPSTFAGHYDFAAYLILLIPIMGSMIFGYKKWYLKIFFFLCGFGGLISLLMTASRVSFGVYMVSIAFMLFLQKKKLFIIPVFILSILLLQSFQGISQRFGSTFSQVDLVIDARTGKPIGIAKNITGEDGNKKIVIEERQLTGEDLPQGSKYINIQSGENKGFVSNIEFHRTKVGGGGEDVVTSKSGQVIVKKAFAYDVSFTTRFQGEWPRAIEAFQRNFLLGSGYGSINLATDGNYLRILGETGILGLVSFAFIFLVAGIYLWRIFPDIEDKPLRSLIIGVTAGILGLSLNAILIDVFEASKVAFVLWLTLGSTLGIAQFYQKKEINYLSELKHIFLSTPVTIIYFFIGTFLLFSRSLGNYFVGDDFTWLRWAADCKKAFAEANITEACGSFLSTIANYFIHSEGFFYRPGTKTYFYLMYPIFEVFPTMYHVVSLLLHFFSTAMVYLIANKILKNRIFAVIAGLFFLVLSVHAEAVYWISVTGHMIASASILFSLFLFIKWRERQKPVLFLASFFFVTIPIFFHEFGAVGPLLLISYDMLNNRMNRMLSLQGLRSKWYYLLLLFPIPLYYFLRMYSHSLWFHGDYSYNIGNLGFNIFGNVLGYIAITLLGDKALPFYTNLRLFGAVNPVVVILAGGVILFALFLTWWYFLKDRTLSLRPVLFPVLFFIITLLPFLGLGNLSPRYVYLPSVGIVLLLVLLLKKIYENLVVTKKMLGISFLVIVVSLFSYFHVRELFVMNGDWKYAGKISNSLLVDLNYAYTQTNTIPEPPILYFVNVPIRYNEAWVFPVGLQDALWFSFKNTDVTIKTAHNVETAFGLAEAEGTTSAIIFEFQPDGSIAQITRTKPSLSQ